MHKSFSYQGYQQHYNLLGNGPLVLFIHGFGEDGHIWDNLVPALQSDYTLLIPHLPGSNASELLSSITIESMAEVISTLLAHENCKAPVTILGHSMGGYIALAMAEKYPQLISKLGLIHSTAFADSEAKIEQRLKSIEFISNNGAASFLDATIPNLFKKYSQHPQINILKKQGKNFTAATLVAYYQAMIDRPDRRMVLTQLGKPILIIAGFYDMAVPLAQSLQQAYLAQTTHFHILKNSAHMGMWEETDGFLEVIGTFLKSPLNLKELDY